MKWCNILRFFLWILLFFPQFFTKPQCLVIIFYKFPTAGQKYEFALKWKINIVTPNWVFDSVQSGYCLPEDKFSLRPKPGSGSRAATTSTPTSSRMDGLVDALLLNFF